jgi:hypothetical protein
MITTINLMEAKTFKEILVPRYTEEAINKLISNMPSFLQATQRENMLMFDYIETLDNGVEFAAGYNSLNGSELNDEGDVVSVFVSMRFKQEDGEYVYLQSIHPEYQGDIAFADLDEVKRVYKWSKELTPATILALMEADRYSDENEES